MSYRLAALAALRWAVVSVAVFVVVLVSGCGDENELGGATAAELTTEGWALFEMDELDAARSRFEEALEIDERFSEADNGLGWTWLRLNFLDRAAGSFESALDNGLTTSDPHAGLAVAFMDLEPVDLAAAAAEAESALSLMPRYRFAHDPSFNWRDLRLILAQAYFGLQRYVEASSQVDSLGGRAPDPSSEHFVEELLLSIEELGEQE